MKEENDLAGQGSQVAAGIQVEDSQVAAGGSLDQGSHLHLQVVNICVIGPWPAAMNTESVQKGKRPKSLVSQNWGPNELSDV